MFHLSKVGSCETSDIACCVLVRVLTHAPERNEFLIDSGFMGLSQQGFNELGGTYANIEVSAKSERMQQGELNVGGGAS